MAARKPKRPYKEAIKAAAPQYDPDVSRGVNALQWTGSAFEKLGALMGHYGIDREDNEGKWFLLALNLAADYVPNFEQSRTPKGRKPEKSADDVILFGELKVAELSGKSVSNKARHLTRNHKRFKGQNPGSLRLRYIKLKDENTPEGKRLRDLLNYLQASE